MLCRLV